MCRDKLDRQYQQHQQSQKISIKNLLNLQPLNTSSQKLIIPEPTKKKGTFSYTTKYVSYIFNFNTKQIDRVECGTIIEFSKCSLNGLDMAYRETINNYIKYNYYIACPIYTSKRTKRMLDTQLSVTGKCYVNEDELFASIREIQEEIGITCNIQKIKLCTSKNNGIKTETTFIADVSDSRHFDPKKDCVGKGYDDRKRKIQVVVCGKLDSLLNMYSKIFNRPESNDLETIKFVRFISLWEFV